VNISDGGDRLRTDPYESANNDTNGLPLRATSSGNKFASVGIDSANGLLFGDGASFGYTAQMYQTTPESLDVGFAKALPPTNVAGTATTGGTLAAATYTYWVRTATGATSCNSATESAPSIVSAGRSRRQPEQRGEPHLDSPVRLGRRHHRLLHLPQHHA
ncbi:MAG: hypothetical protein WB723_00060, partial [Candidatus Acidiferrales bacterium]